MEIESLENFVSQQFEMMDRLIQSSQEDTASIEKLADFIPPIDPADPFR